MNRHQIHLGEKDLGSQVSNCVTVVSELILSPFGAPFPLEIFSTQMLPREGTGRWLLTFRQDALSLPGIRGLRFLRLPSAQHLLSYKGVEHQPASCPVSWPTFPTRP